MQFVFATGNAGKVAELARLLPDCELVSLSQLAADGLAAEGLAAVDETGATLADNAWLKAHAAAMRTGRWTVADDTGLFVDALGGRPGVRSGRFAGPRATPAENRRRLLEELRQCGAERPWTAAFRCCLVVADPEGRAAAEFWGECRGRIVVEPRGQRGFGYDTLFELPEYRTTLAELGVAASDTLTHRARAAARLRRWLARRR